MTALANRLLISGSTVEPVRIAPIASNAKCSMKSPVRGIAATAKA